MASSGIQHDFLDPPPDGSSDCLGSLGNYRVIGELGKGGMGFVFLAEDVRLKRRVALKVMNQKIASTPGSKKRFISEARAMAAVHHDNVATIFEVGERNGTPFMAMELLEGATLENYHERNGEPDFHTVIAYARDIARGLAAAHAQGIVHRDIKPANIWLDTKTNRIKILDFGLALAKTPVDQLSGRGAVVGTPGYLSPEQARSEPLDDRSDLYSTGVVLYELATGALPLKTKAVAEQLIAILAHPPKPLRDRNPEIPQPLADLIHKLMAKEPRDRYRSAKALEEALDEVEVECEKKSEVAQAINQLQLGLEQAVKKKDGGGIDTDDGFGIAGEGQAMPNPFESLPDDLPSATPVAPGVTSSGVHAAIPAQAVVPPSTAAPRGAGFGKPAAAAASQTSHTKVIYIAVGVCAALLLVLIPVIVYLSDTSAIARRQQQDAFVVGEGGGSSTPNANRPEPTSRPNQAAANKNTANKNTANKNTAGDASKPSKAASQSATRSGGQNAGRPNQGQPAAGKTNQNGPRSNDAGAGNASTLITKVDAKPVQSAGMPGAKWVLGNQRGNGSFESGDAKPGQLRLPGWTATKSGPDAGWVRRPNVQNEDAKTAAYAGRKSELTLVSEPVNHATKAGDIFRVSASIGGEGPGKTDYRIILGFEGDRGPDKRFLLSEISDGAMWGGGKQKQLRFEYQVDGAVAGMKPFLEFTISNKNNNRNRAMLDRVVMTVKPKASAGAAAAVASKTGAKPMANRSSPAPDSNATPAAGKPQGNAGPPKKPAGPAVAREVRISTATAGGADATVKRGGGSTDTLGEKPTLTVQTRNDRQIQHVYMRFPLLSLRGNSQPNRNRQGDTKGGEPLPIVTAQLSLALTGEKLPAPAKVRVYGLRDVVSDLWPENKIVWSNSLSTRGLQGLPLLGEIQLQRDDRILQLSDPRLTGFLSEATGRSVTLVLTGSSGDEVVDFVSKEAGGQPPTLVLGLSE